jgi:hypothetical protein
MLVTYSAVYWDRRGEERKTIQNDGKLLRMVVRGIEFVGPELPLLRPTIDPTDPQLLTQFTLVERPTLSLSRCRIEYDAPIPVTLQDRTTVATLRVRALLRLDDEDLRFQD